MKTLSQATLNDRDREAVRAAAAMLRERFGATGIILFGSTARGEAGPDSDLDLLVLLPREVTFAERLAVSEALSPLGLQLGVMFSTVVASASGWPVRPYPLSIRVQQDGVAA